MSKLECEIDIDAPRELVYDVVADPRCLHEWVTIQEELEEAPDGDLTPGSELRQRMKVAGRRFHLSWTVVEAERPSRIVWEGHGPMRTKARARGTRSHRARRSARSGSGARRETAACAGARRAGPGSGTSRSARR